MKKITIGKYDLDFELFTDYVWITINDKFSSRKNEGLQLLKETFEKYIDLMFEKEY